MSRPAVGLDGAIAAAVRNSAALHASKAHSRSSSVTTQLKRGAIACRRCRRLRAKCINHDGSPPCEGCAKAGFASDCSFIRGLSNLDRKDTRPRKRPKILGTDARSTGAIAESSAAAKASVSVPPQAVAEGSGASSSASSPPEVAAPVANVASGSKSRTHASLTASQGLSSLLPPTEEILDVLQTFFTTTSQVGFLHRITFENRVRRNEVGSFLLLAILATSASDTPAVIRRYGGEAQAQNVGQRYFEQALTVAIAEIAEPSLERIQAFYLLANRDWMEGRGTRSWILMGIAIRLASVMCLEKAESYSSNDGISTDQMIAEEEARRTVWHLLTADECLSCSKGRPQSTLSNRTTIPLPCDEEDFLFGDIPPSSRSTHRAPSSLLGNVCLVYALWGRSARLACQTNPSPALPPWATDSEFQGIVTSAASWIASLAPKLRFSSINLAAHHRQCVDLPYLFIHIIFHACHVLTRRSYLADLVSATHPSTRDSSAENVLAFWQNFAGEMFEHAYCAIDVAWQGTRLNTQPGALSPLMAFCVFQSAAIMTYLLRWFWLCPASYGRAQISIQRALEMLERLTSRYNMANSWCATIKGAVETARATASSFNTASDARAALAGEHYTVDPLQSVRPPVVKNPPPPSEISRLINNGQEIRASLPSASTSHALAAPYAFPQQGEVDGNDTLADFLPNSDAFDMPLLDSQDLLAFMGDQGIDWSWS